MQSTYYSCQTSMKLEFSQQIFKKASSIKFHENLSSRSLVIPCRWTDMMKLIAPFCHFVNAPKKLQHR
jgi:hypothetical protein